MSGPMCGPSLWLLWGAIPYLPSIPLVAPLVAQMVRNLPATWETWVQSLDRDDPLQKGMATHSSILA